MAEIGLVASLVSIAGAAVKLTRTLYVFGSTTSAAREHVDHIAKNVFFYSDVLELLVEQFDDDRPIHSTKAVALAEKLYDHSCDLYPSIVARNSSEYSMSNPGNIAYGLSYFNGDDPIPQNVPELINGTDPAGPKNFFFSSDQDLNKLIITPQGEWLIFTIPRVPGWRVSVSLCYDSFTSIDADVTITTDGLTTKPALAAWDVSTQRFGTDAIRRQLGVLNRSEQSQADRGIMSLQTTPEQLRDQVQVWYGDSEAFGWANISFPDQNFIAEDLRSRYAFGTIMCTECGVQYNSSTNKIQFESIDGANEQIFQDVMSDTANTALAFQAYYTTIGRMAYYDILSYLSVSPLLLFSPRRGSPASGTMCGKA